jgi:hypothetical protein
MSRSARLAGGLSCLVALAIAAGVARAEKTLRYKFKPGETIHYVMRQEMVQNVTAQDKPVKVSMTQTLDMSQKVESVDDEGTASVTQTVERIRMTMTLPQGQGVDYDSASDKAPEGLAAKLAPVFGAVVKQPIKVKITSCGTTRDLKLPEGMLEQMKKGLGPVAEMFSDDSFRQMANLAVLPEEPVVPGKTWSHQATLKNAMFGKAQVDTTFRYEGEEDRGGKPLEKIASTMKMQFGEKIGQANIAVKQQDNRGTIYFDNTAGRIIESTGKTRMKIEISIAGMKLDQDMEMTIEMKLQPPGSAPKPKSL